MPPLLQLDSVTKSFDAVRALRHLSFDLQPGEIHALLGENGAGKSTLIKLIAGVHRPETGSLQILGETVRHLTPALARQLGVACVYQQPALFPDLTVAENIALRLEPAAAFRRVIWSKRHARAAQLLRQLGADIQTDTEVHRLSMPEQQLVEIACALGAGSRIVLMDEPTASLTQAEQVLLFAAVRGLRDRGAGVIYISHRLEEIFALADRVTVLRDGESVGTSRVSQVTESSLIQRMVGRAPARVSPRAASPPGACKLSLRDLGCAANGVRNVSLDLHAGEIVGVAGLVGAGRTELARTIFGISPADSGAIFLNGEPVEIRSPAEAIARGIALVPEDRRRHGIVLEMSIAANISMASHRRLFPGGWLRPNAERALALAFIRDLAVCAPGPEAQASSLSGGNQQKIALARWLAAKPGVLLLDEPTQGVDVGAKAEIHQLIRTLAQSGVAVLLISSDLPEILAMSDRIAVMRGGSSAGVLPGHGTAPEVMAAALGQPRDH
jgi:rhamnose transport system ATP-binding protein